MSKSGWVIGAVVLTFWGFYSCWHFGYQSGYADGHETAWKLSQPSPIVIQAAMQSPSEEPSESDSVQ
jgi:hypothetical protein